jgi:pseudouridine synthase
MPTCLKFFKPFEVLCQFTDERSEKPGRRTLKDFIALPGVYAAGRLDYRSEGLLLLTADGALIQRLTDPRFEHAKTYAVQLEGIITPHAATALQEQIVLPGIQTRLARVEIIPDPGLPPRPTPVRAYHPTSWIRITLNEGKKHQVRRMTAAVGFPTLRLVRMAIGPITLGDLQPGEWRYLTEAETQALLAAAGTPRSGVKSSHAKRPAAGGNRRSAGGRRRPGPA